MSAQPCTPEEGLLIVPRRGQWAMMLSLVFVVGPAVDAVDHLDGLATVAALAGLVAFVGLYWRTMIGGWVIQDRYAADDRQAMYRVLGLAALVAGLCALGGGNDWSGLWCFVGAATGLRVDRRFAIPMIVAEGLAAALVAGLVHQDVATAFSLFVVTFGVGMLTGGFRRLRVVNRQLGVARDEIGRLAVADERLRFARDLHDLLGHSLSVIALKSELANRLIDDHPEQAATHMRDIEAVTRRALSEVREAVAGYARPLLAAELAGARDTLAAAGIEVDAGPPPVVELPPDAEAVLAWAVREGTTNVLRHASDARRVRIRLDVDGRDAALELIDDGAAATHENAPGTGLAGLAERVARVRGRMDAAPAPGGAGFRLAVTVPLEAAR
ncbi:MAG TPA: histidine kinase [Baekduia sp.]|uniref:sensor histidine kinase n=1 Tax=Baekduia sp. TaxID=2600305 RepID=UPI002D782502|nr:histidine kinase [Baekduia sp.]HET6507437.1 histidine kinase [Baekduia sp.]